MSETTSPTQYVSFIGRLYPDNRLELMPGFMTTDARLSAEDPSSRLQAECVAEDGNILLRYGIPASPYCVFGQPTSVLAVRGKLPMPAATRQIRFLNNGIQVFELPVSDQVPDVQLTWKPGDVVKGSQTITWSGNAVQYFLRYSRDGGKTWNRLGSRTTLNRTVADFDELPGGDRCLIAVVGTDGVKSFEVTSAAFSVPTKGCQAIILSPADKSSANAGEAIVLRGQGIHLEKGTAELDNLEWSSSKDGVLGQGMSLRLEKLSVGTHRITLRAGIGAEAGHDSITIAVRGVARGSTQATGA